MKRSMIISIESIGCLFITIICSIFMISAISFEPHDFANYYFGSTFFREGHLSSDIYFPHIFNLNIAAAGYKNIFVSYAPNTPFLSLFFFPFTYVSLATAKIIFNSISLLLFLFSIRNLFKVYQFRAVYLFVIPIVFLIPIRNSFLFGQVYLLLFFLLSEGFLAYKKEAYMKMSVFWGIAILLKVFPIVLFGFLIFKKNFKALIYLSVVCLILFGMSLLINGIDIWEFYFRSVLPKSGNGEITSEFVQNYQSMFMFLKALFPSNIVLFSMTLFSFKLMLLILSFFVTKNETSSIKVFSFWILISILLSPYGSTYISVLLIFPFLFFIKDNTFNFGKLAIIILFFLISNIPTHYFSQFSIPFSFPRLLLLLLLFFLLIKNNLIQIPWKKSSLFIVLVMFAYFLILKPKENSNNSKSLSDKHILNYDYTIKNDILHYIYWNANGKNIQSTGIQIKTIDTTQVSIVNNQVFYNNKQLTSGKDNKLKPAIVNDNTLLYLTDIKKGIGFYNLHKISLNKE